MKKTGKILVSTLLAASVCIGMTGCSKGAKECKEIGTEFIEASFDREIEDMAELCEDEDDTLVDLGPYANENDAIDALLERASVSAGKASIKKDGGTVTFTITLPDYEAALDEDPEDVDDFEDALDEAGTIDIEITLEFVNKRDNWVIDNWDDFIEDFYEELYDIDFGFTSEYDGWIEDVIWWNADYSNVFDDTTYYIDLDLRTTDETYNNPMNYTFSVIYQGNTIFTSNTYHDSGYLENYCYIEDTTLSSNEYFPSGEYTFTLNDDNGVEFFRATCTVE